MPPNVAHHEHLFVYVTRIAQVFKILVDVHKMLTPIFVNVRLAQTTSIMVWPRIPDIQIYEPTMVHHYVVNVKKKLHIKPTLMGRIVLQLTNFDKYSINKFNVALELWKWCCQQASLIANEPSNIINNDGIDARCNKYIIIIYCTLVPIAQRDIMLGWN
jgi:hypothetical protein